MVKGIIKNSKIMFCENTMLQQEAFSLFNENSGVGDKIHMLSMGVFSKLNGTLISGAATHDFGFIGRLSKKKGVELLIKAVKKLEDSGSPSRTLIAGDGEEKEYLQKLSKGSDINFIGFVSDQTKISFFNKTKVVVFPSINAKGDIEGLPVALREALYAGKLVVASKATNIELLPEWEQIKDSVLLLKDAENINELADTLKKAKGMEKEFYQSKSAQLKEIFKHYRWNVLIHEYIKLLTGEV